MKSRYRKQDCYGCRALEWDGYTFTCKLGHKLELWNNASPIIVGRNASAYHSWEYCEKPRSYKALNKALGVSTPDKDSVHFGDILYRPCASYHGKQNFINPSIVLEVIHKKDGDYVRSSDAFRQTWTDKLEDIGVKVFKTKKAAQRYLENSPDSLKI